MLAKLSMPFKTKPAITQNDVALRAMCGVYPSLESKLGLLNSERTVLGTKNPLTCSCYCCVCGTTACYVRSSSTSYKHKGLQARSFVDE